MVQVETLKVPTIPIDPPGSVIHWCPLYVDLDRRTILAAQSELKRVGISQFLRLKQTPPPEQDCLLVTGGRRVHIPKAHDTHLHPARRAHKSDCHPRLKRISFSCSTRLRSALCPMTHYCGASYFPCIIRLLGIVCSRSCERITRSNRRRAATANTVRTMTQRRWWRG
jgi:hypothetical protein